ncbi:SPOR domain-containing protein [Meiothermus sp.]|uniref:SPOR domain-containing protein n=1 Tax=Meiothermus sp. TaxID=1955249 RepID=UPI0021DDF2FF|nr:SPOR domain-containing protein [Meiothermus sp.]GIW34546.1 MAG: sporulation protein [Meiothermus sp.]
MGWLRTNWLDALIFLLVAAIMAGVVLFLTGVNPFAGSRGGATPPSSVSPPAPQAQPPTPPPAQPQPQTTPATPQPRPQTPPAARPQPQPEPETVVTVLPIPQAPTAPAPVAKPVPAPPKVEDRQSQPVQPETARPVPAPRPERPNLTADAGGTWRVAVGSFGNRENAERLAATLRRQGYPVRLETSGSLTRVWVGPYDSQARARTIASTLGQYQPQVARMTASSPSAPTPQSQTEPAPSASRFLQVGAFRNTQSAQSVVETVRQAGYPVVLVEEGGLVKVRVGPLDDASSAAAALRARGLEVLEVR